MAIADISALERLFLGLGDKTRLRLLSFIADGPVSVGQLVERLGESQPKVSRHLAYMRQSGIVSTERDGKWIYYTLSSPTDPLLRDLLVSVAASLSNGVSDYSHPPREIPLPGRSMSTETAYTPPEEVNDVFDERVEYDENEVAYQLQREEMDVFLL